jgi:hypothetical protein
MGYLIPSMIEIPEAKSSRKIRLSPGLGKLSAALE